MNLLNLEELGEERKTSNPDQIRFCCPFCSEDKYRLYVHKTKKLYHCQKCKASGRLSEDVIRSLDEFDRKLHEYLTKDSRSFKEETLKEIPYPDYFFNLRTYHGLPFNYMINRGITEEEIKYYKIGYCSNGSYSSRIVIPIFDQGKLVYFVARTFTNQEPKYLNSIGIKKEEVIFKTFEGVVEHCYITEGVIDAIKVAKIAPAISLLGKVISSSQVEKITNTTKSATVMLDKDAHAYAWEVAKKLSYRIPTKIILLTKYKDPGSLNKEQIYKLLKDGKE